MAVDVDADPLVVLQPNTAAMDDVRRAREFYRYLQPHNLVQPNLRRRGSTFDIHNEHIPSLSSALAPFCQLTTLRCNATKAMLNVMDRDVMYFLAEASRVKQNSGSGEVYEFVEDPILMSCSAVPLHGRICELTLRMHKESSVATPFFVIPDLKKSHFQEMSVIAGPPYYRFYAGTPITTRGGINIGSLAIMDIEPREGLTPAEEAFLGETAEQIMVYLETNRQAIEGRRSRKMAKGLEDFIAGKKSMVQETPSLSLERRRKKSRTAYGIALPSDSDSGLLHERSPTMRKQARNPIRKADSVESIDSQCSASETDDQQKSDEADGDCISHVNTFARAANLLRECLGDLGEDGSVTFLSPQTRLESRARQSTSPISSPSVGVEEDEEDGRESPKPPDLISRSSGQPAAVVAVSKHAAPFAEETEGAKMLTTVDDDTLRELMRRYPGGRLWSLDDSRTSSSESDSKSRRLSEGRSRRRSHRKQTEAKAIKAAFPAARQVLFAPLWDAAIASFSYGVFIASTLETRSFNTTSELSFLNSFCSTIMAECSRLDAMKADKQKSDFVGTISHEMRSPLHGVLASVEFLADTEVNGFQRSLIDTIDSCGRTLLDTINHVLDFSKVNSFQKHWQASNKKSSHGRRSHYLGPDITSKAFANGAPPLLQLFGVTDISAVLEEVVDGLVLGQSYNSGLDITDLSRETRGRGTTDMSNKPGETPTEMVDIILDVQQADWAFMTQPGAVRRIIMNITGNAMKYTSVGSIKVKLELKEPSEGKGDSQLMVLTVTDTGKGISPQFLSSKLFVPFAQENALAPGTGLGLSIVHSIVTMLGGSIDVKSMVGRGTTVQVALPLTRPLPGQQSTQSTPQSGGTAVSGSSSNPDDSMSLLQSLPSHTQVTFYRQRQIPDDDLRRVMAHYVRDWYRLEFTDQVMLGSASIVIVEEEDLETLLAEPLGTPGVRPAIVVMCCVASRHSASLTSSLERRIGSVVEFVAKPCGPYKLARSLRLALEKKQAVKPRFPQVAALGVIAEVPTPNTAATPASVVDLVSDELQEMDLSARGEHDAAKVVQATETFAASQSSQQAQMALHYPNPELALRSPGALTSEGDAFPFPAQEQEESKKRRESYRGLVRNESLGPVAETPSSTSGAVNSKDGHSLTLGAADKVDPHVLLVDDNKINLKLLETFLRSKRKYTNVVKAEDGKQAVDAVREAKEQFEIIFMDISMPVMNGFEATRAIRDFEEENGTTTGAMIIALTGLASGRDQSEGFDSGCDIYMTKPVSFKEVGKLLDNWEAHQKLGTGSPEAKDEGFEMVNSMLEANGLQPLSAVRSDFEGGVSGVSRQPGLVS